MYGNDNYNAGMVSLRGDSQAWRDLAGRNAVKEEPDQYPADMQYCFDRLEEVRTEMGVLFSKMYAIEPIGKNGYGETSSPPYKVRIGIQDDLDTLSREEMQLQGRIEELRWILPANDQDGDAEEDEAEKGDMTQPNEFVKNAMADDQTK